MKLELEELSGKIIGCAIEVHRELGPGYLKACRLRHGLLLNFSTMPLTVKRVIYTPDRAEEAWSQEAFFRIPFDSEESRKAGKVVRLQKHRETEAIPNGEPS